MFTQILNSKLEKFPNSGLYKELNKITGARGGQIL